MSNRTANYAAFYVTEPFDPSNLKAQATKDFVYYNLLRAWKGEDTSFPFVDAHANTYNVRDESDWEKTLKPRLHERLRASKNIILFLSSITKDSRALREEITFGIETCELPVIAIYPEYSEKGDIVTGTGEIRQQIKNLWDRLPAFRDKMGLVPTCHIPMQKSLITTCLKDEKFMVNTKTSPGVYTFRLL